MTARPTAPNPPQTAAGQALGAIPCSAFRGPIELHQGTIRVRVNVQREGSKYWARVVADPIRPDSMPLASGPTRKMAIHAACEKASIPPNAGGMARELAALDSESPTKQNG